jgi:hypothetical protein
LCLCVGGGSGEGSLAELPRLGDGWGRRRRVTFKGGPPLAFSKELQQFTQG